MQTGRTADKKAADKPKCSIFSCFFPWGKRRQVRFATGYPEKNIPVNDSRYNSQPILPAASSSDITEDHLHKSFNDRTDSCVDTIGSFQLLRFGSEDKSDFGCLRKDKCTETEEHEVQDNVNSKLLVNETLSVPNLQEIYLTIVINKLIRDIDEFLFDDLQLSETEQNPHTDYRYQWVTVEDENNRSEDYLSCCVCSSSLVENVHESAEMKEEEDFLNECKDSCALPVSSGISTDDIKTQTFDKILPNDNTSIATKSPLPSDTLIRSCSRGFLGCPCLLDEEVEPTSLRESDKFLQKRNFSFYPYNGILNNYVQPVKRNSDIGDLTVDQENIKELLSEACNEELVTIIDCERIDDPSSVYFSPDYCYPIPDTIEPDNCWYTGVELEEFGQNESGDSEYNYQNISEETAKSGQKKKSIFSRLRKFITKL